jgi:hypothetical protein
MSGDTNVSDQILLVEGSSDEDVVGELLKALKIEQKFSIFNAKTDNQVIKALESKIKQSESDEGPKVIGVILDADDPSETHRVEQIQNKISGFGYHLSSFESTGTLLTGKPDYPRLGFWIMPDNENPGALEDFLKTLAEQKGLGVAEQCVAKAKEESVARFKKQHHSKAVVHTYIAWQDKPGRRFGLGFENGAFDPHAPLAKAFVSWLTNLFDLEKKSLSDV